MLFLFQFRRVASSSQSRKKAAHGETGAGHEEETAGERAMATTQEVSIRSFGRGRCHLNWRWPRGLPLL